MEHIKLDGKKYAIGLRWSNTPGDKVAAEVASLSEELGMSHAVIRKTVTDGVTRTQVGLSDERIHAGMISAAALLADIEDSLILIEEVGSNSYWICAIADNQVLVGSDIIIEKDELYQSTTDIIKIFTDSGSEIKLCVSRELADFIGVGVYKEDTFASLVEKSRTNNVAKTFKKYTIKGVKGIPRSAILFLVFASLCGGLTYYTISSQNAQESELERQQAIDETMVIVKKEPSQEELLAKALEEEKVWFTKMLISQNSPSLMNDMNTFVRSISVNQAGWTAISASYSSENPDDVTVKWKKAVGGTALTLKSSIKYDSISFNVNGDEATSSHKVISKKPRDIKDGIEFIKQVKYTYQELMHDMELLGYQYSFGVGQPTERPQPIAGIKDPALASARQLNIKTKTFILNNSGLMKMNLIGSLMNKAKSAAISKITIQLNEDYIWQLSGEIYEN